MFSQRRRVAGRRAGLTGQAVLMADSRLPEISPRELTSTIAALRRAQSTLRQRPAVQVIDVIGEVIDAWLRQGSLWLERAATLLPEATGFSAAMVRHALPLMLEPLRAPAVADLVAQEAGARRGPPLIAHVLAGNLPGLAAIPASLSLAIGSSVLLKAGSGDRVFPALFAASVTEYDAQLGACIAARYWRGGDRACEDVVLAESDLVVASGDDATIADLDARRRGPFIGHGHRISFAVVTSEVADDEAASLAAAARLAADIVIWEQRGCLSPQLCFVEGSAETASHFGAQLAHALGMLARQVPPPPPNPAERLALRRLRDECEWNGYGGSAGALYDIGEPGHGTVVVEPRPDFRPTPLCRSVRVQPVADACQLEAVLTPVRGVLEGAGIAVSELRRARLTTHLTECGVHRVCEMGEMQRPPLAWRQGGRPRLAEWATEAAS